MQPALLAVSPDDSATPAAGAAVQPRRGGKRFMDLPARDQLTFEARCTDDFVRSEAFVRIFDEILEALDFSGFEACYCGGGRPAFEPRLLTKLILFGQCLGVRSAREISRRLACDLNFMWLAHELQVDHETLSDFRRRFHPQLKELFKQAVRLGVRLDLVPLAHVALDGTKIAAHGQRRACNQEDLEKQLARLDERLEEMLREAEALDAAEDAALGSARGDEVPADLADAQKRRQKLQEALQALQQSDQEQICVNDPEAPVQKTQDGKRPGYNGQIAVDAKVGYVVAEEVTPAQNDTEQFVPLADQAIENLGQTPQTLVADGGYHSPDTLSDLAEREWNVYIKQRPTGSKGFFGHDDFTYDEASDTFTCPAGQRLVFRDLKGLREKQYRRYRAAHSCANCPQREQCISAKVRYRELLVSEHEPLLRAMRQKLATPAGELALEKRKQTVERTFGTIKAVFGLRQFLLRGLAGARIEFTLAALAVNLCKLAAWLRAGGALLRLAAAAG
jgi:transposase